MRRALALLSLVLAAAAVAAEPVAVAVTSERPGAADASDTVALQVYQALVREGWGRTLDVAASAERIRATGFADPRKCKGARSCVAKLATLLGAHAVVVSVDVGKLGGTLAIHLEAVAADSDRSLQMSDVTAGVEMLTEKSALPVTLFARALAASLKAREAEATAHTAPTGSTTAGDTPLAHQLEPGSTAPVEPAVVAAAEGPSLAAPITVTAATALTAAASVVLLAVGLGAKSQYDAARITDVAGPGTSLTRTQAEALAGKANTCFSAALGTGVAAGVGAAVSGYLWANLGEPSAE